MKILNSFGIASAALALALGATSCEKLTAYEKTIDGGSVEFMLAPMASGTHVFTEKMTNEVSTEIKNLGIDASKLKAMKPRIESIEILDDQNPAYTFDVMDKLSLDAESKSIPKKTICGKDPVPHTGLRIIGPDMEPDIDWIAILNDPEVTFNLTAVLNQAIDHSVKMKLTLKYDIKYDITK